MVSKSNGKITGKLERKTVPERQEWQGDTPVFLVIRADEATVPIDLDEPGWAKSHEEWMRVPGIWQLLDKSGQVRLQVVVFPGEQPYYTARHVGIAGSGGSNEITAYGIGKKVPAIYEFLEENDARGDPLPPVRHLVKAGDHVRLWLLPDGSVCGGDTDLDQIGISMVKHLGPR